MDPAAIVPFDLQRMFVGDHPLLFHLEIVVRTLIVYGYSLVLLRWLGSRTIGQLSTIEFLLVIALGSAVGDPMFYPDVPLVHALVVVTVVVLANRGLDILVARSKIAERVIDGEPQELIDSGTLSKKFLDSTALGLSEVFQQLRQHGIEHLGQVRAAYIEPDGKVAAFKAGDATRPGLPISPPWELARPEVIGADDLSTRTEPLVCRRCGAPSSLTGIDRGKTVCGNCGHNKWTPART